MGVQQIDRTSTSSAPVAAVWALLADGATWPAWSSFDAFEVVEPGPDGGRLGSVHELRKGRRQRTVERVVELVPERRFAYELVSGLPLDGYRASVDLAPTPDGGTTIRWRSHFRPRTPGTGWFWRLALGRFVQQTADALARGAEAPGATPAARDGDGTRPARPGATPAAGHVPPAG